MHILLVDTAQMYITLILQKLSFNPVLGVRILGAIASNPPIRFQQLTVTNCTDQTPSLEAKLSSASPEIPRAF